MGATCCNRKDHQEGLRALPLNRVECAISPSRRCRKLADSYWALKGYAHDFVNHVKRICTR